MTTQSMVKRGVIAGFSASILVLVQPSLAEACGCGGVWPSSVNFKSAAAVFVGTVEEATGAVPHPIVATFFVTRVYRGPREPRIVVSGTCDMVFAKGVTYLVYAQEHAGALFTHNCTRTRPLSDAGEDVRYLENLASGRPQALVYGAVFRRIIQSDGSAALQALFEPLHVVAVSARGRRSVVTDKWGPYQIVLAPGDYEIWVARRGQRVTASEKLSLSAGEERRLSLTAEYP